MFVGGTNQIYIEHNGPRGPGTANAYIQLETGQPSADYIKSINDNINDQGKHGLGDDMLVLALPINLVDVMFEVVPQNNLTDNQIADLLADIEQFVRCAFRENAAYPAATRVKPQSRFSFSTLNQELRNEFKNIASLYTPNRDFLLGYQTAQIGSLNITVESHE